MRLSEAGLSILRDFEGFSERAYPDPGSSNGLPVTIGYGSTRDEDGRPFRLGDTITRERADELLRREVAETERQVAAYVSVPITQPQFDALCSFAYNVGVGAFGKSTLLKRLNAGDYAGAAEQFGAWINAGGRPMEGLRRRRRAERALFDAPAPIEARTAPPAPQPKAANAAAPEPAMSPFVIPALDLLARSVPTIAELFRGEAPSKVAERNIDAVKTIADKVLPIVLEAAGAPNLQAAAEAAATDPKVAAEIDAAARREYFELQRVSIREARDFAVSYAQMQNVRTVVGRFTFPEFLSLVFIALASLGVGYLMVSRQLGGELLGGVVTLMLIGGWTEIRKFWFGLGSPEGERQSREP